MSEVGNLSCPQCGHTIILAKARISSWQECVECGTVWNIVDELYKQAIEHQLEIEKLRNNFEALEKALAPIIAEGVRVIDIEIANHWRPGSASEDPSNITLGECREILKILADIKK